MSENSLLKIILDARRSYDNGFMPVPIPPNGFTYNSFDRKTETVIVKTAKGKGPIAKNWQQLCAIRAFSVLWNKLKYIPRVGYFNGSLTITVDFDNHPDANNPNKPISIEVYRFLCRTMPEVFQGAILENTPSGGVHAVYKYTNGLLTVNGKGKTYALIEVDGVLIDVEILTGNSQAVGYPTPEYNKIGDRDRMNTQINELPELPNIFIEGNKKYHALKKEDRERIEHENDARNTGYEDIKLVDDDAAAIIDGNIRIYKQNASSGFRHDQLLGLSCNLFGINRQYGIPSISDIERAVERFCLDIQSDSNRKPQPSEARDAINYGYDNPSRDICLPYTEIWAARKQKQRSNTVKMYEDLFGGNGI